MSSESNRSDPTRPGVRQISAEETRDLRHAILRPNQPRSTTVYPMDDHPDSVHFGAFLTEADDGPVSVASLYHEPPDDAPELEGAYRIRGMATREDLRGRGLGSVLVEACLDHARSRGGSLVWCNARTTAAGFYERCGFHSRGPVFDLPGIGPHVIMQQEV